MNFRIILIISILGLNSICISGSLDTISIAILKHQSLFEGDSTVINFISLVDAGIQNIERIYSIPDKEINYLLHDYKIDSLRQDVLFVSALTNILKVNYLVFSQLQNTKERTKLRLLVFNSEKKKYIDGFLLDFSDLRQVDVINLTINRIAKSIYPDTLNTNDESFITESNITDSLNTQKQHLGAIIVRSDKEHTFVMLDNIREFTPVFFLDLESGIHKLKISSDGKNYLDSLISVKSSEITFVDMYFKKSWLNVITMPDSAEFSASMDRYIFENDQFSTLTPIHNFETKPGFYSIKISKKGYSTINQKIWLKPMEIKNFHFSLKPLSKNKALFYSFMFPGMGQWYSDKTKRALLMNSLAIGFISSGIILNNKVDKEISTYNKLHSTYLSQSNQNEIDFYYEEMIKQYDKLNELKNQRNLVLYAAITVYLYSLFDAYFYWPYEKINQQQYKNLSSTLTLNDKRVTFKMRFQYPIR